LEGKCLGALSDPKMAGDPRQWTVDIDPNGEARMEWRVVVNEEGEAVIQIGDKFRLLMSESTFHLKVPSKRVESGKIEFQNENSSIATPPSVSAADIPMS